MPAAQDQEPEPRTTFRIPDQNLEPLQKRIEKLVKRAVKLHLDPPRIKIESSEDVPLIWIDKACTKQREEPSPRKDDKIAGYRRYHNVRLIGEAPVIPGWALVAVIEHGGTELGNVIRVVPGMKCPLRFRKADPLCEHCGFTRRRLETFVLLGPNDEIKQIGRNCLADFCRDPEAASNLCAYSEMIASALGLCEGSEDDDFYGFGPRAIDSAPVDSVLAMTARIIRHLGWVPRSQADPNYGKRATADVIQDIFFWPKFWERKKDDSQEFRALQEAAANVEDKDIELAEAALAWIRSMRPQVGTLNDYLYNALVVASEETALKRHFGILCSVVSSYKRQVERDEERKRKEKVDEASEHFGTEGKRDRWFATLMESREFEGQWGVSHLYKFAVHNGRDIAIWWSSKEIDTEIGEQIVIEGSVKKHSWYGSAKQTELTRCNIYDSKTCKCGHPLIEKDKKCPACKAKVEKSQAIGV